MGERTLISAENEAVKIRIRYHADIDRVGKSMEKGFDGEEYTEADECIDEDW